jgi:hypothetical protein
MSHLRRAIRLVGEESTARELGAIARAARQPLEHNPYRRGRKRELWAAGWQWEDREIREGR